MRNKKKTLIIPDTHGRTFWKGPVETYGDEVEKIVFLGDYVDPYTSLEGITVEEAISNFREILELKGKTPDKVVLLYGNHDLHYAFKSVPKTSRYSEIHATEIRKLFKDNSELFSLAHSETIGGNRYLLTHAGMMKGWYADNSDFIGAPTDENLNNLSNSEHGLRIMWEMSKYRRWLSRSRFGSIVWSDIRERTDATDSDQYTPDGWPAYQIFGHTQLIQRPSITDEWACIDCRSGFVLTDNGLIIQV